MTRKFSIMLSKSKYSWSYLASYIENEEVQPSLTIYSKSSEGDHYIKPTTALTLRGKESIRSLYDYLILLDEKHDFFNKSKFSNLTETFRPCTLAVKDPFTIIALNRGDLVFIESDYCTESYYKPPKEISLNFNAIDQLYFLLQHIYGVPIYTNPGTKENKNDKETTSSNSENKQMSKVQSGWGLLK